MISANDFIHKYKIKSDQEFAELFGCGRSSVTKWRAGTKTPEYILKAIAKHDVANEVNDILFKATADLVKMSSDENLTLEQFNKIEGIAGILRECQRRIKPEITTDE